MMASDLMLFWAAGSPPSWRVVIALEEKGQYNYLNKELPYDFSEYRDPEILKLNPKGQVPILCDADRVLTDSIAICLYLEEKYRDKGKQLLSDDDAIRDMVQQKMSEVERLNQKILQDIVQYKTRTKTAKLDKERYEAARQELTLWEEHFSQHENKTCIVGKTFTMADVVLFPVVAILFRLGLNAAKYPGLAFYYSQLKTRASIQNTWPAHWLYSPNLTLLCDL